MKTKVTRIALALAAIATVTAQEGPPEGGRRGPGGERQLPPAVLKEFDKDGDGKLNEEERQAARTAMEAKREEARKRMLAEFDKNGDGKLDEEERKAVRTAMEAKRKALVEKYDADGDGKLSPDEIKAARDAGEELPMIGGPGRGRGPGGPGGDRPRRPAGQ